MTECPKCKRHSGDDWKHCGSSCPMRDGEQAPAEGDAEFHQLGCLKGMLEDDEGARHSCTCGAKTSPTRDQLFTALNEVAELVGDCEEWAITEDPQVVVGMVKDYMAGVALSKAQPKHTACEFTNELGNAIRITIEGPTSTSESVLTPMEAAKLRSALNEHAAPSPTPAQSAAYLTGDGKLHVTAWECHGCGHRGIDDGDDASEACSDCDWRGPCPDEDVCPGCGREETMVSACPKCGDRYYIKAEADIVIPAAAQAPAVTHGSDMLEPLIYAAMMHNGKPKTVAEFERVAANVADMLQRRAADAHEKPVASIYISADGSREFDDWRVDLPPGNHQLFTAPRPAQPQPESLPHPGAPEAEEMIDKLLAEYNRPANMKNAARAGYMAARRLLQNARQPLPAVEDAEPIGWGGVIETCAELCDPHFIAQQDLDELKRYAGNWNSTYRFFPIYAPGAQLTEGPAVLAERDSLKAAIVELNAAEFAYARYIRSDGLEKHRQNRERRIAAWQAARKLVGADGSNVPVQGTGGGND